MGQSNTFAVKIWHPFRVLCAYVLVTGGLRYASTTGYFLAALQAAFGLPAASCLLASWLLVRRRATRWKNYQRNLRAAVTCSPCNCRIGRDGIRRAHTVGLEPRSLHTRSLEAI